MVFAARQQTHDNPEFMQPVIANRFPTPVSKRDISVATSRLALNMHFTTNGMWTKNNTHSYVAQTSSNGCGV